MNFDPRDHDSRDRGGRDIHDPRDAFMCDLDLPRGVEREIVRDRDHEYNLRGSETRTLSTVGAFRVVPASKLRDHSGAPADPRSGDLRNLREQGLVETLRIPGHRDHAVVLTKRGRELLERHRDHDQSDRQSFYAGLKRARELEHDGHPDRDEEKLRAWALEHDLPYFDDQVHFPDVRIEYGDADGRRDHEDIEVLTIHYRGAHGSAAARAGFTCYGGGSARTGGGGRSTDPRLAEELLR